MNGRFVLSGWGVMIVIGLLLLLSGSVLAEKILISGSNTLGAKLIPQCAQAFLVTKGALAPLLKETDKNEFTVTAKQVGLAFGIKAHGSSTGFRALIKGEAGIAMSSRPIKAREVDLLVHDGDMLSIQAEHTIAVDGLAVLVHPTNPVDALTMEQIAKIFAGEIRDWSEVGGDDLPISLYARDENSGTWDTFKGLVLRKTYNLRADAVRFESNDDLSDSVAQDTGGIGFTGFASIRSAKAIAVADDETQAVAPTHLSVATEDYPLTRRLYLYTPPALIDERAKAFIEFCQSEAGQNIVADVGFISQNIIAVEQPQVMNAPETYQALSGYADRLSVNFRFQTGSSELDNKAVRDIQRLLQFLKRPENVRRPVYLVGFSDAGKTDTRSHLLSRFRALSVWSELFSEGVLVYEAIGLGAFMPVASNRNLSSRMKNSRVEVWLGREQVALTTSD